MVIAYINGGFGVGKTTVAELLVAELQPAMLFDPEQVGSILTETLFRIDPRDDFQAYPAWIDLFDAFLRELHASYPAAAIVVPMSILDANKRLHALRRMQRIDREFYDFTLVADVEELTRRIFERPLEASSRAWCLQHVHEAPSVASFEGTYVIDTTRLTPREVAASILATIENGRA